MLVITWGIAQAVPASLEENARAIQSQKGADRSSFDFVVLGDTRDGAKVFAALLRQAAAFKPRFILHTGDLVTNGRSSEFVGYVQLLKPFRVPVMHVPGNHDIRGGYENYRHVVGSPDWSFDYGPYRFIGLDNAQGVFSAEALAFARKQLSTPKRCFLLFHDPPAVEPWTVHSMKPDAEGGRGGEMMGLINAARSWGVFVGHIHLFDEQTIGGVPYVICGGGGAPLHTRYGFGRPEYGFVLVHVSPAGMSYKWVPLEHQ